MELAKSFEPHAIEAKWYPLWESRGDFKPSHAPGCAGVLHPAAAAQRHRHAAHGARVPDDADGRADPVPPDARRQHALAARHRPCGHRDADRRRAAAEGAGRVAAGSWPRDSSPSASGRGNRSPARRSPTRCAGSARRATGRASASRWTKASPRRCCETFVRLHRGRPHLSRQAPRQLGPDARHRRVGPRGRKRGRAGQDLGDPLSAGGRRRRRAGRRHRRHDPAGDDAGRRRGRGEPRRRTLHRR